MVDDLTPQPFSIIAWQVEDMAARVRELQGNGVKFEHYDSLTQDQLGIWTVPGGSARVAWFRDPDGNVLSLVESANDQPS
jgi:catechol 2,3-dioxygenase-like lactoylglutathione lyase family enzyme